MLTVKLLTNAFENVCGLAFYVEMFMEVEMSERKV